MKTLIQNGTVDVDGRLLVADILIDGQMIQAIGKPGSFENDVDKTIDAKGNHQDWFLSCCPWWFYDSWGDAKFNA